jgi:MFS family permease
VLYSIMVGVGETYVAAFALAIGMGEVISGLITTLPLLMGALLQLATPWGVRVLGSQRRWVLLCASLQSVSLIPLAIGAIVGTLPVWVLFLVVSLYWACNMAAAPAWNTWMTMIIPSRLRANYFGRRSRLCQLGTLGGILAGGGVLAVAEPSGGLPAVFALLFGAAALARGWSTTFLARQSEPALALMRAHRHVGARELLSRVRHGPDARLLAYMLAVQVSVHLSGAYFNPYMLVELDFSKATYTMLLSASFLAKSVALPFLGRFAHRYGARRLLRLGGVGIVPLAFAWMLTDDPRILVGVQIFAGVVWGCYELATFLLMLETIREEERTSVLTTFNVANAAAIGGGSLAGGALLGFWGAGSNGYMVLFGLSTLLRLGSLTLLARVTTESRHPAPLATAPMAVRSNSGTMEQPALTSIDERSSARAMLDETGEMPLIEPEPAAEPARRERASRGRGSDDADPSEPLP